MRTRLALSLLAAWTLLATLPALASAAQIVVTGTPGLDAAQRADVRADARVTLDRGLAGSEVVSVPVGREARALAALNADPRVRSAAPNVAVRAAAAPTTDPFSFKQWYLENDGTFSPSAQPDADIDAATAWASGVTGSGIDVAVVDTAIDTTHPDLVNRIDTPADPQDFVVDPCSRYSVPTPDHGTAVAGVIAAEHDNNTGIAGVAPQAKVVPVHALDNCGDGSLASVIPALGYAADHAPIVVAAFATPPGLSPDEQADVAAQFNDVFSAHPDTLFIVPSGNEANDDDANPVYPCSSTAANLICVGMSDVTDGPDCLGNVGATSVDLFAPGQGIETTVRGTQFGVASLSGTSMAAPMVAGVAALVESTWTSGSGDTASTLADALRTVPRAPDPNDPNDPGVPGDVDARAALAPLSVSGGRLNAAKALGLPTTDDLAAQPADWAPCDDDHDGFRNTTDQCPTVPGTVHGCPDADGDGIPDASDNCPSVANPDQANADGDGLGDACDPTPRGDDADGDGVGALDDRCPTQPGPASLQGCPPPPAATPTPTPVATPTPTPTVTPVVPLRIVSVAVRVAHDRRTAKVTVRLTRTAGTQVTVERRVKRRWTRVLRRSLNATAGGRAMTVPTRRRGSYRVTVALAGAKTVRRAFRV